jgi:phosphonate transport system substrate-binding protein
MLSSRLWCVLLLAAWMPLRAHDVDPSSRALTLGIHPYLSTAEIERRFRPLVEYLSRSLGTPVELRVATDYEDHIVHVGNDQVDIAYLGPGPYVTLVDRFGEKPLLARLETNGEPTFRGKIITRRDRNIRALQDLRGKRFAFGSHNSTMSYLIPRFMLEQAGVRLDDLARYEFLGSHTNVALGVLLGEFDAGAVKQEIYEHYADRGLVLVECSAPISEHLFVAREDLDRERLLAIRHALLDIADQPGGTDALRSIKSTATDLVPASDTDYDGLREIMASVAGGH